ncbi:MAG: hypothetical protein JEZ00_17480 [Anaerolineaceae bacterium]|nr:hypothetical protein [Anaerolineaceae bacterium]
MITKRNLIVISVSIAVAILLGSIAAGLYGSAHFWQGLPGAAFLIFISCIGLYAAWHVADKNKIVAWVMVSAFLIRILLGIGFTSWLPEYGYDTPQQNAGYLFRDAYERDQESWGYNIHDESLWYVYNVGFDTDQYGGLLVIGAIIYRSLSTDFHRSILLVLLSAFLAALAIPFLWKAVKTTWSQNIAATTIFIYALYPDSILFTSSQMREPYLLAFSTIGFWAVQTWRDHKGKSLLAFAISAALMLIISSKIALFILAFLLVWFILVHYPPQKPATQLVYLIALLVGGLAIAIFSWGWLKSSAAWEVLVSVQNSGWVQKIVADLGEQWQFPFLTGYGLVQPLLPAAIAEPSILIWKIIAISRALGWYLVLPFMVFGFFSIQLEKDTGKRWLILWTAIFMAVWILLSSSRAGGDLWDNPRYRLAFLPWIALFIAWAWDTAKRVKNGWLLRWAVLIGSFVMLISHWYVGRYTDWFAPLDLTLYLGAFGLLGVLVIGQGIMAGIQSRKVNKKNEAHIK